MRGSGTTSFVGDTVAALWFLFWISVLPTTSMNC